MDVHQKLCRLVWLWLASLVLIFGYTLGLTTAETPEPPMGLAPVEPAMPMAAFSLPALNGSTFDSSALEGKVVVVRFWATW